MPRRLLQEKRKTIGLRVPSNPIALALLDTLGEPMLSTSLMLPGSDFTESDPEEIKDRLEKQVDLIIHGGYLGQQPTTVIDLTNDSRWCCAKASATLHLSYKGVSLYTTRP